MTPPKPIDPPATDHHTIDLPHRRRWIDDLIEISDRDACVDPGGTVPASLRDIQANGQHTLAALIRLEAALLRMAANKA